MSPGGRTTLLILTCFVSLSFARDAKVNEDKFISSSYRPKLLYVAAAAQSRGDDPLMEAKSPEQRHFLTEYYRVIKENAGIAPKDQKRLLMEPLRRCGIEFPDGTKVVWLPLDPPLLIVHTPDTIRKIEKIMGLTPAKISPRQLPNNKKAEPNTAPDLAR